MSCMTDVYSSESHPLGCPLQSRPTWLSPSEAWVRAQTAPRTIRYKPGDDRLKPYLLRSHSTSAVEASHYDALTPETVRSWWKLMHSLLTKNTILTDTTGRRRVRYEVPVFSSALTINLW